MEKAKVAVIGAGSAGMSAYRAIKRGGESCFLIENNTYGTTCARTGCMPSKLLIAAANSRHAIDTAEKFGIDVDGVKVNRSSVMRRVRQERDRFVNFVVDDVHDFPEEDRLLGEYYFVDDHTMRTESGKEISAEYFVIATGTKPFVLPVFSKVLDQVVDTEEFFNFHILPKSICVVGTGAIGLELGQALTRLGVRTVVLGIQNLVGGISDPAVLDRANDLFGCELNMYNNAEIYDANIVIGSDGYEKCVEVCWEQDGVRHKQKFDYVLPATGIVPNLASLCLEATSLRFKNKRPDFNIETLRCYEQDNYLSNFFIAGDVTGERMILHEAIWEGQFVGKNVLNAIMGRVEERKIKTPLAITFTDPEIAIAGKSYAELDFKNHVIGSVDFENQGRSRIQLKNYGMLNVYAEKDSGRFVGCEMCGPAAEHIGHLLAWAIEMKMTIPQMLEMPFYHPVIEEGVRTALRSANQELEYFKRHKA